MGQKHVDQLPAFGGESKTDAAIQENAADGMTSGAAPVGAPTDVYEIAEEDAMRAHFYGLLARFLGGQPDDGTLELARSLEGGDSPLGQALRAFAEIAKRTPKAKVDEEYGALFHGHGAGGEMMPYASMYLTGFLYEKPLAHIRKDLADFGIQRAKTDEPEDHIAFLCEVMHGMITGAFGAPQPLERQKEFFDKHIAPWAGRMFKDLEGTSSAVMYMPLATAGRLFIEIEAEAFEMGS